MPSRSRRVPSLERLTEAAQIRLTYIAGIRDDLPTFGLHGDRRTQRVGAALLDATPFRRPAGRSSFRDVPSLDADDVAGRPAMGAGAVARGRGWRPSYCAVDLTRRNFGIPVVRMVDSSGSNGLALTRDYMPRVLSCASASRAVAAE